MLFKNKVICGETVCVYACTRLHACLCIFVWMFWRQPDVTGSMACAFPTLFPLKLSIEANIGPRLFGASDTNYLNAQLVGRWFLPWH